MLVYLASVILPLLFFGNGFVLSKWIFQLQGRQLWLLSYPIGMAIVGCAAYFLWLAGLSWTAIVALVAVSGVMGFFVVIQAIIQQKIRWQAVQKWTSEILQSVNNLSPVWSVFLVAAIFGGVITIVWGLFIRPVVWDALVLYDWRALRISDGWQIGQFLQQFNSSKEFGAYDFSHPFLSSIWQALGISTGAAVSTAVYIFLFLSVLVRVCFVFRKSEQKIIFLLMLCATPLFLTVWTQNYAAEPMILFWFHILLFFFEERKLSYHELGIVLLFLLAAMLSRMSEPYWFVFLAWILWQVFSTPEHTLKRKLLTAVFFVGPVLATFFHWLTLQEQAQSFIQAVGATTRSSYDPNRYANIAASFVQPQFWLQSFLTFTIRSPIFPFIVFLAATLFINRKISWRDYLKDPLFVLWILWLGMLAAALVFEVGHDWPNYIGKERLLWRAGLPLAGLTVLLICRQVREWSLPNQSQKNQPLAVRSLRKRRGEQARLG